MRCALKKWGTHHQVFRVGVSIQEVDLKTKTSVVMGIRLPIDLPEAIEQVAETEGIPAFEWIKQTCLAAPPANIRKKIEPLKAPGRPRTPQ